MVEGSSDRTLIRGGSGKVCDKGKLELVIKNEESGRNGESQSEEYTHGDIVPIYPKVCLINYYLVRKDCNSLDQLFASNLHSFTTFTNDVSLSSPRLHRSYWRG